MNKAIMIIKEECCNKCTALCETCNVERAIERIRDEMVPNDETARTVERN